jgi:hypothetical protein
MSSTTNTWQPSTARTIVLDGFTPVPRGTIPAVPSPLSWPAKDPSDVLDYKFDVAAALVGNLGDRISSVSVVINPNAAGDLALVSSAADGCCAVFWFSGGQASTIYTVQITVVTVNGRTIGRTVLLPVLPLATPAVPLSGLTTDSGATITDGAGNPILLGS